MSAGKFSRSRYQGDLTTRIYSIRVQPETLLATFTGTANPSPEGGVTESVSAKVSGGRRTTGVSARKVRIQFAGETAPAGYEPGQTISLPILTPALFNSIEKGDLGTYLGQAIIVVGKTPEYVN